MSCTSPPGREPNELRELQRRHTMIDVHLHLLPGIDDGPSDLEEVRRMCRRALEDGCRALVATPHQRHDLWENRDRDLLEKLVREVREVAREVGTKEGGESGLEVYLGAEVRIDSDLLAEVEALPGDCPVPLAGSRYLLLELDRDGVGPDPLQLVHELTVAGWIPIFAHPEFILGLEDVSLARELVEGGALFQLTAMSITGDFGRRAQAICRDYLDAGLAHFVASDAHGAELRPPGLSRARREIARVWGEPAAERLTHGNPAAVLEDRLLEAA